MHDDRFEIRQGNCLSVLKSMPDNSIDCCVTSPPYFGLRDYGTGHWEGGDPNCNHFRDNKISSSCTTGHKGMKDAGAAVGDMIYKQVCPKCGAVRVDEQIGLEETPEEYVKSLVDVFREVRRVLKDTGTFWLNIGDSYASSDFAEDQKYGHIKHKDIIGIPWMLAFALRQDGWYLRQDIIWDRPNSMPESVKDRCTKAHEYIFLLTKNEHYLFDYEAIQEPANYDGRKDTLCKGGDKYRDLGFLPEETTATESFQSNPHQRWQIKTVSSQNESQDDQQTEQSSEQPTEQPAEQPEQKKAVSSGIRFGGSKYGDNDDPHYATKSGNEWVPRTKNCKYDGQQPNSFHVNRENGGQDEVYYVRNKRDVWHVPSKPYSGAHFATYPEELIQPCILAGCPKDGIVLDPFNGSGTTGIVALNYGRKYIGIELNPEYVELAEKRISDATSQMLLPGM